MKAKCTEPLELVAENHHTATGGPEFAVINAAMDGQHRILSMQIDGEGHAAYLSTNEIIDNTKRNGDFKTCIIQSVDRANPLSARTMLSGFFGGEARITAVHRVQLKRSVSGQHVEAERKRTRTE
jgi:hypothetical protein